MAQPAAMPAPDLMPVTLISGFLGAGKSTLLSHLLLNREGLRVGLIVNDMADVNVDAAALSAASHHAAPVHVTNATDRVVELSNGCICAWWGGRHWRHFFFFRRAPGRLRLLL
jgi:hypothetical protein